MPGAQRGCWAEGRAFPRCFPLTPPSSPCVQSPGAAGAVGVQLSPAPSPNPLKAFHIYTSEPLLAHPCCVCRDKTFPGAASALPEQPRPVLCAVCDLLGSILSGFFT